MSNVEATQFGDKYVLVEHIATGGMAEVYRAQYSGIEGFAKELVVKRLRPEFGARTDVVEMFLDEARVAATLTHNNVVHTYDLGEVDGEYFIAMELLKGEELVAVLRRAAQSGLGIPREIALGVVLQALEGLYYVHTRTDDSGQPLGLVHRDINPTNIHVGYDGVCKIVDFGIAATRATVLGGNSGQFAGKLSYMAPEQVLGEDLDGRADLFALGVVLYEMCLGRRLFRGKPDDVRRRVLGGDVPAPTFVDPSFPPELEAVIMKALEVDPSERYQNADHMFRELEEYVTSAGIPCTPRRVSAFMAELFGSGAPANVDYDDQYSDLVDEALDFDKLDAMRGEAAPGAAPDWVRGLKAGQGGAEGKKRRSLTIGDLSALVAEPASAAGSGPQAAGKAPASQPARAAQPAEDASAASSGSRPRSARGSARAGGGSAPTRAADSGAKHKVRASESTAAAPRPSATTSASRAPATRTTANPTLTGRFGATTVNQQRMGLAPFLVIVGLLVLAIVGYGLYVVVTQN